MTLHKHHGPLLLLKESGAFCFQFISQPTTTAPFGGASDRSRGEKTSQIALFAGCRRTAEAKAFAPDFALGVTQATPCRATAPRGRRKPGSGCGRYAPRARGEQGVKHDQHWLFGSGGCVHQSSRRRVLGFVLAVEQEDQHVGVDGDRHGIRLSLRAVV